MPDFRPTILYRSRKRIVYNPDHPRTYSRFDAMPYTYKDLEIHRSEDLFQPYRAASDVDVSDWTTQEFATKLFLNSVLVATITEDDSATGRIVRTGIGRFYTWMKGTFSDDLELTDPDNAYSWQTWRVDVGHSTLLHEGRLIVVDFGPTARQFSITRTAQLQPDQGYLVTYSCVGTEVDDEIFVMLQRPEDPTSDVATTSELSHVATPVELDTLPINAPLTDTPYFRTASFAKRYTTYDLSDADWSLIISDSNALIRALNASDNAGLPETIYVDG